ncbi:hypothetical protein POSPLADRAFT_1180692 [Postia placenta MAD-698-R-SB12]|uniref:Uncharacterized protein n=1 Tax=Postia placenta MAD-698-R-SB12 TaxID=670580 RepID=A0A1X6N1Q8_9APHY|nr:hypothetical protein POSPLADRAFT_1180692 [Postia placenta MAD-698-R-SB12]OSX62561.1 hypothetical protein POSPLADRAFT_1180692 [Postia placenta MAD-698-R-SB12]
MSAGISVVEANLTTLWLGTMLYAIFLLLAVSSSFFIMHRQVYLVPRRPGSKTLSVLQSPMIMGVLLLLLGNTAHWIITVVRSYQAFVYYEGGTKPMQFYLDQPQPSMVTLTGVLVFCMVVGDAMLIYRTWVVWSYNTYVIIFPAISVLGFTTGGIGVTYEFTRFPPFTSIYDTTADGWVIADVICTLCINVYCTAVITWKIWGVHNKSREFYRVPNLSGVLVVMIESAALYTTWALFYFASFQAKSELQNVAAETMPAIGGISLMLINVRALIGWVRGATGHETTTPSSLEFKTDTYAQDAGSPPMPVRVEVRRPTTTENTLNDREPTKMFRGGFEYI